MKRKAIPVGTIRLVLHESGYMCANPACRTPLTLDIHHMEYVSDGGGNEAANLLPLCPNCHALHHRHEIPNDSIRSWKMLLVTINEGFDRSTISLLLLLEKLAYIRLSGDGLLRCAPLVATSFVSVENRHGPSGGIFLGEVLEYTVTLSDKGRLFVEAWKRGDQQAAVNAGISPVG
jgi:hypothetical protein